MFGIALLLVVSVAALIEIAALQGQISQLQNQLNEIPDTSGQLQQQNQEIQQMQQQISKLSSEINAISGKTESFDITEVCVSTDQGCQGAGPSAFSVMIANNGTQILPSGNYTTNIVSVGNESHAFASFSLSIPSLDPGGPAEFSVLSSWQSVQNKTGTFVIGEPAQITLCLPGVYCAQQDTIVQA